MSWLRRLIPSNRRGADMKRRREERQQRAADLVAGYADWTPSMWDALKDGEGLAVSTPQPEERSLPPQRRYVPATWFSKN